MNWDEILNWDKVQKLVDDSKESIGPQVAYLADTASTWIAANTLDAMVLAVVGLFALGVCHVAWKSRTWSIPVRASCLHGLIASVAALGALLLGFMLIGGHSFGVQTSTASVAEAALGLLMLQSRRYTL